MNIRKLVVIYFVAFAAVLSAARCGVAKELHSHLSLVVEPDRNGKVVYKFEGRSLSFSEIYKSASSQYEAFGGEVDYYVIFRDDVSFNNVINVRKTLQAIGYLHTRYFVFSKEKRYMVEVVLEKSYPYSISQSLEDGG